MRDTYANDTRRMRGGRRSRMASVLIVLVFVWLYSARSLLGNGTTSGAYRRTVRVPELSRQLSSPGRSTISA